MPCSHSCDGIHRGLLDSIDADSGNSRAGSLSGEREARQKCSGTTYGRFRLSVVAILAFGWLIARILPSRTGHLRGPVVAATSSKSFRYGNLPCPAHAESAGSDNLQRHHVISDITGTTGLAILDASLDGNRDVHALAALRDPRIRASHETIAKSLVGD